MNSILETVMGAMGGNIFGSTMQTVKECFPSSMSDAEKAKAELAVMTIAAEKDAKIGEVMRGIQSEIDQRIMDMEGTASDLKAIPIIGPIIIFLRGMQRMLWGFGVLFMDFMVFSGEWKILPESRQDACFLLVNILVLSFLFGERAMQNVAPLIERLMAARK